MGHWEQIGRDNATERERRAQWPRWCREMHRHGGAALAAAAWILLLAIGLWAFGLL
jgi:hypothetical protein